MFVFLIHSSPFFYLSNMKCEGCHVMGAMNSHPEFYLQFSSFVLCWCNVPGSLGIYIRYFFSSYGDNSSFAFESCRSCCLNLNPACWDEVHRLLQALAAAPQFVPSTLPPAATPGIPSVVGWAVLKTVFRGLGFCLTRGCHLWGKSWVVMIMIYVILIMVLTLEKNYCI